LSRRNPFPAFTAMLKTIVARDMSCLGPALRQGFEVLNLHRATTGADTYGQGFAPHAVEPALLLLLTDGTEMTKPSLDDIAEVKK
jgi:integrator complex subunit 6